MADDLITNLRQKVNILLSKKDNDHIPEQDEFLEMLRSNETVLLSLFETMNILKQSGLTNQKLIEQIQYGEEARALKKFEHEYADLTNTMTFGAEAGTIILERDMLSTYQANIVKFGASSQNMELELRSGLLLIPLPYTTIQNSNTNEYFNSSNEKVSFSVVQNDNGPLISITLFNQLYTLQGYDSTILGTSLFTKVIQQRLIMLEFSTINSVTHIYNLEAEVDVLGGIVTTHPSNQSIQMSSFDFLLILSNLPFRVRSIHNMFKDLTTNVYDIYKRAYTTTIVQELVPQITRFYTTTWGNTLSYGLFGQGAAVSIAQLYNLAESTIRLQEVRYSITTPTTQLDPPIHVVRIPLGTTFDYPVQFDPNQVFGCLRNNNVSANNRWRWENFPIMMQGVDSENNFAVLTEELALTRQSAEKFIVHKDTNNRRTNVDSWIETRYTNVSSLTQTTRSTRLITSTGQTVDPNLWKLNGIAGGSVDSTPQRASFFGLNLLVRNQVPGNSFTYTVTQHYTAQITQSFYLILKPDDLSSESTNTMSTQISWMNGSTQYNQTVSLTPQRIAYGTITVNAYVGLLRASTSAVTFSIDSSLVFNTSGDDLAGNIAPGNSLLFAQRSDLPYAFNTSTHAVMPFAVSGMQLANNQVIASHAQNDQTNRTLRTLINPPFCWQQWSGSFTLDYKSAYLSVNSAVPSISNSQLSMDVNQVLFSISPSAGRTVTIAMYGYAQNLNDMVLTTSVELMSVSNVQNTFSPIQGWSNTLNFPITKKSIQNLDGTVEELLLPDGIYNVFSVAEQITNLQSSVAFLEAYAFYLHHLINNLTDRLSFVENTMSAIIIAINDILNIIQPNSRGAGSDMLSFIGTSIGMFFPLTGLAVNILSNLVGLSGNMTDGNVLTGVIDIVTGAILASLGLRKFAQRVDRKYGATNIVHKPVPPNAPPSYDSLFGRLGVNSVGTMALPPYTTPLRLSSGVFKNTSYNKEAQFQVVNTLLWQEGLFNSYSIQRLPGTAFSIRGVVVEFFMENGILVNRVATLTQGYYDDNDEFKYITVSDDDFYRIHGRSLNSREFVLRLHAYSQATENFSDILFLDEEALNILTMSNLSIPLSSVPQPQLTTTKSGITYFDVQLPIFNSQSSRRDNTMTTNTINSPMSMTQFASAFDPFNTDQAQLVLMLDNVYDFVKHP